MIFVPTLERFVQIGAVKTEYAVEAFAIAFLDIQERTVR
jgi:hypothetical protein